MLQKIYHDERFLLEQKGFWVKGILSAKTGTIVLTPKRLAFVEEKVVVGGGLLGKAVGMAAGVSKPKLKVDVPIDQIASWSQPRKLDLLVVTKDGSSYKLRGVDYERWDEQLKMLTAQTGDERDLRL